jgi:hypothetical protein
MTKPVEARKNTVLIYPIIIMVYIVNNWPHGLKEGKDKLAKM